jgi:hypothetical protein
MADQNESAQELLLDIKVAEASALYKFYLNQEKKILGTAGVVVFLVVWELVGSTFQLINPMFMSAPSLIWKAAVQLFASGRSGTTSGSAASNFFGAMCCRWPLVYPSASWSAGTPV